MVQEQVFLKKRHFYFWKLLLAKLCYAFEEK